MSGRKGFVSLDVCSEDKRAGNHGLPDAVLWGSCSVHLLYRRCLHFILRKSAYSYLVLLILTSS